MTHETDFKFVNLLHPENVNLTHKALNTSITEPVNWWNMHLVSYDTITSRTTLSSNGQCPHYSWSIEISDVSQWYKTKCSVGRKIALNPRIRFIHQLTAIPEFHSLYNCSFQIRWLFLRCSWGSRVSYCDGKHSAVSLYSTVKSCMNAIQNEATTLNRICHHGWCKLQSPGRSGGGQNQYLQWGSHFIRYWRKIHTMWTSNGLKKSKLNYQSL